MNMSIKRIFGGAVIAGLATLFSLHAESSHAHFHLAVGAYLGQAFLAPGDYNISVLQSNSGLKHVVVAGQGGTAYAMPLPGEKQFSSGTSSLQLVELGGDYFVKEYRSQNTGKVYSFGVPTTARRGTKTLEITN